MINDAYIDSLTAAGIDLFSLEHFSSQGARETERRKHQREQLRQKIEGQRRTALKQRMDRLTASIGALRDDEDSVVHLAGNLAPALAVAMAAFVQSGDTGKENWMQSLAAMLIPALSHDLTETSKNWLLTRGLPVPTEADIATAISKTVLESDPLRIQLLQSELRQPDGFLTMKQAAAYAQDLAQRARDILETLLLKEAK